MCWKMVGTQRREWYMFHVLWYVLSLGEFRGGGTYKVKWKPTFSTCHLCYLGGFLLEKRKLETILSTKGQELFLRTRLEPGSSQNWWQGWANSYFLYFLQSLHFCSLLRVFSIGLFWPAPITTSLFLNQKELHRMAWSWANTGQTSPSQVRWGDTICKVNQCEGAGGMQRHPQLREQPTAASLEGKQWADESLRTEQGGCGGFPYWHGNYDLLAKH